MYEVFIKKVIKHDFDKSGSMLFCCQIVFQSVLKFVVALQLNH